MPHRTIVVFVIIMHTNTNTDTNNNNNNETPIEDPTHHLFQAVSASKSLDGMPVLPATLTVNGRFISTFIRFLNSRYFAERKGKAVIIGGLYTRWRPPQYLIASLGGGHRLGCGSN